MQVISDLLKPERTNLVIREDRKRGVFVDGLSEWVVRTPQEVIAHQRLDLLTPCSPRSSCLVCSPASAGSYVGSRGCKRLRRHHEPSLSCDR